MLNQVSEVWGLISGQRKETNTITSNLRDLSGKKLESQKSTTAGDDILECNLPIPTKRVLHTEKKRAKEEKV